MLRDTRELWWAFLASLAITLVYGFVVSLLRGIPAASSLFGHSLGVLGFGLMLMTETLYTLRKRSRSSRWGSMAGWLRFHIFTGIVGPYMVLLHTSWKFSGLAGIVLLLTIIVVASGFVGRYIYTAVPRTAYGIELDAGQIQAQIAEVEAEMLHLGVADRDLSRSRAALPGGYTLVLGRTFSDWAYRLEELRMSLTWGKGAQNRRLAREQYRALTRLHRRKRLLQRQVASLVMARRLMALWHTIHIPIGLVLFASAFLHIAAAVYYATLLR